MVEVAEQAPVSPITIKIFDSPKDYDEHLQNVRVPHREYGRALGLTLPDGTREIVIDKSYYCDGRYKISEEYVPAIIEHEKAEFTAEGNPNKHILGIHSEYQYMLDHFGPEELKTYHYALCNIMGGLTGDRTQVLNDLLEKPQS